MAISITLTVTAAPAGMPPTVNAGGVVTASAFGEFNAIAPGTWIEIYGSNLSSDSRGWLGSDFNGVNAPTSLDRVKVTVNSQPAFLDYISPGQVNAQVPSTISPGPAQLIVSNANGTSAEYAITVNAYEPGLLAPSSFNIGGKQYVKAQFADGTVVLPTKAISGTASRPAMPGETIIIYGIGFGPVLTSSNQSIPAGEIVTQQNSLVSPFQMLFGQTPAKIAYAGLAPNYVGLYQFNVVVPSVPDSDAVPLSFLLNGVSGSQTLHTVVHQ